MSSIDKILQKVLPKVKGEEWTFVWKDKSPKLTSAELSEVFRRSEFKAHAQNLTLLNVRGNAIEVLPAELSALTGLKHMNVRDNPLVSAALPKCAPSTLVNLDCGGIQATGTATMEAKLEAVLSAFQASLSRVSLDGNGLCDLPQVFATFQGLKSVDLSKNGFTRVPDLLCSLPILEELNMSENSVVEIPVTLQKLAALKTLDLSHNKLTEISVKICANTKLVKFSYKQNPLPQSVLNMEWNQLKSFLQQIRNDDGTAVDVVAQQFVDAQTNDDFKTSLTILQSNSSHLKRITHLSLPGLKLKDFLPEILDLQSLTHLSLAKNFVGTIPTAVERLEALESMDISFNRISVLPATMARIQRLRELLLEGNPTFENPPQEIIDGGLPAIKTFLGAVLADSVANKDILLVAMGAGEAGKTSTVNALLDDGDRSPSIDPETGRTIGIDIKQWAPPGGDDLQFRVLDFGGQGVYHTIHQFFFNRRSLFLLVWRLQRLKGAAPTAANMRAAASLLDWFDGLELRVPGATVLLVATHADTVSAEEAEAQVVFVQAQAKAKAEAVMALPPARTTAGGRGKRANVPLAIVANGRSFVIDARGGRGVRELRAALVREAQRLPFFGELVPRPFIALRQRLRENAGRAKWLVWKDYRSLAAECAVSDELLGPATRFLHSIGELRHFHAEGTALIAAQLAGTRWQVKYSNGYDAGELWLLPMGKFANMVRGGSVPVPQEGKEWRVVGQNEVVFDSIQWSVHDVSTGNKSRYWETRSMKIKFNREFTTFQTVEEGEYTLCFDRTHFRGALVASQAGAGNEATDRSAHVMTCGLLMDTVFVDCEWIIDVLKGLIRHDRSLLQQFGEKRNDEEMIRRIRRLIVHGILHPSLLPFLWPGDASATEYWALVARSAEGECWQRNPMLLSGNRALDRIVALLKAFDIVMKRFGSEELLVPSLLDGTVSRALDARAFLDHDMMLRAKLEYNSLPPGFFERVLVNAGTKTSHMDLSAHLAALYVRGTKAQLCISSSARGARNVLTVSASQRAVWNVVMAAVEHVETASPGLVRLQAQYQGLDSQQQQAPHKLPASPASPSAAPSAWLEIPSEGVKGIATATLPLDPQLVEVFGAYDPVASVASVTINCPDLDHVTKESSEPWGSTAPLPNPIARLRLKFNWKDQGWGNQKGRVYVLLVRDGVQLAEFGPNEFGLAPHEWKSVELDVTAADVLSGKGGVSPRVAELMRNAAQGDEVQVWFEVGGGGGHAISARGAALKLDFEAGRFELKSTHAVTAAIISEMQLCGIATGVSRSTQGVPAATTRLALVLVDAAAKNRDALQNTLRIVRTRGDVELVGILCPGYEVPGNDYAKWWPAELSEFEHFSLFVDMRGFFDGANKRRGQMQALVRDAEIKLDKWRGTAPKSKHLRETVTRTPSSTKSDGSIAIVECVPCPRCVLEGTAPPGFFSRDHLILALDEINTLLTMQTICDRCGPVPVSEILSPEVFLSYQWGPTVDEERGPETQFVVKHLRRRIEATTQLLCWLDIQGGMSYGENIIARMKTGIAEAKLVVVFLTDQYLTSKNCRFEFRNAAASGQYILPVLLDGWSGEYKTGDQMWWQHCATFGSPLEVEVSQEGVHQGWAELAATDPLDLRKFDATKPDSFQERQLIRR